MTCKPHSQPVLSIAVYPSRQHFVSSGADAVVARYILKIAGTKDDKQPEKAVNTKHAGQQGLSVRSDGKIFATAGWDARVRVYSCKTMKELAVLKWHKVGCYATAFADIMDTGADSSSSSSSGATMPHSASLEVASSVNALDVIKQRREDKARMTHWLAAGGKDGKISLWEIY
jgi:WD40 repeat protein